MTYIWKIQDSYPGSCIGSYDRETGPDRFLLKNACDLSAEAKPWRFVFQCTVQRLRKFDDLVNNAMVPLVSSRLADLVSSVAGSDIQLLPTEIHARDGDVQDYCLLNALFRVPAIDRSRSEFWTIPGFQEIMGFHRLVLMDECLNEHHIARCAEYASYLLVSDSLASVLMEAKMTGFKLTQPCDMPL